MYIIGNGWRQDLNNIVVHRNKITKYKTPRNRRQNIKMTQNHNAWMKKIILLGMYYILIGSVLNDGSFNIMYYKLGVPFKYDGKQYPYGNTISELTLNMLANYKLIVGGAKWHLNTKENL